MTKTTRRIKKALIKNKIIKDKNKIQQQQKTLKNKKTKNTKNNNNNNSNKNKTTIK